MRDGEIKQVGNPCSLSDGVYIIQENGKVIPFIGESTKFENAAYVGVVQGSHSVAIALYDTSENEITLTVNDNKGNSVYKDNYIDALQDWDGKENTERLKQIGLNTAIKLKDGEYIPTLAEMYLICLNQKAINAALHFVRGQELKGWYWSSTEYSSTLAWRLYLSLGNAYFNNKAVSAGRVRLVKQFL